ncbi:hypothetical protein [Mycobacterium avium]|uniref:hypothetical protein n=1 Tax=Mycobacterium avium TaxID=1764 RepID=UPI0003924114|nr:hypothetical protein [Mycobacterium avium]QXD08128.1 hypothetical protein BB735_011585 [Mycobacterium avium subsp. hominissuis]BAN31691.1 hypothetical protein MAH_2617 [Mycobacterium avium subsp. hominissuis TH135]
MMLRHNAIREAADLLHDAQRTRRPIGPLTERFPGLDVAAAYAIQQANLNRRTGEGRLVVGHTSWFRRHLRHPAGQPESPDRGGPPGGRAHKLVSTPPPPPRIAPTGPNWSALGVRDDA